MLIASRVDSRKIISPRRNNIPFPSRIIVSSHVHFTRRQNFRNALRFPGTRANERYREGVNSFNNKGLEVMRRAIKTELILDKLSFITEHSRAFISENNYRTKYIVCLYQACVRSNWNGGAKNRVIILP